MLAYLMLFASLTNAVCLNNASFFVIDLCKCFYFHALSLLISFFLFASCTVLLICLFFLIICSHCCFFVFVFLKIFFMKGYELSGEIALKNNLYYYYYNFKSYVFKMSN